MTAFTYRHPRWIAYVLFAFSGIVGAGLMLGALALLWDGEVSARSLGFGGVAVFFIAVGWLAKIYMTDPRYAPPSLVFFDSAKSEFTVEEADGRRGVIPYSAIRGVEVRKTRKSSGKSPTTYWVVFLRRNDGAYWDLKSFRRENLARDLARELAVALLAGAATVGTVPAFPPIDGVAGVTIKRSGDQTNFNWANGGGLKYALVSLSALLGFSVVLGAFVRAEWSSSPVFAVVIAVVAVLLGLAPIFRMVIMLNEVHRVSIGDALVTYAVGSRRSGKWTMKKTLPIKSVSRVRFCYDIYTSNSVHGYELLLLDEEMSVRLAQLESRASSMEDILGTVMEAIQIARQVFRLRFPGLKTVDMLRLEVLMEEAIRRAGGKAA